MPDQLTAFDIRGGIKSMTDPEAVVNGTRRALPWTPVAVVVLGSLLFGHPRNGQARQQKDTPDIQDRVPYLLAARREGDRPPTNGSGLSPGEYSYQITGGRKYLLYVPLSYSASRPTPLVLFFHGGGGHMEQGAASYGWREKANEAGFIVAFPNGSSRLPRQHLATWNAGNCCGYARDHDVDDVTFVRRLIADIEGRVNVDTSKRFATGMSNGGMMVYRLACEMADTFAAVAAVAGTDNTTACNPSRPISIMHIHARDDTHVLFDGGAGKDAFRDTSKVTDFTSVAETIRRWVSRNTSESTSQLVFNVPGAHSDVYHSKYNTSRIELIVTDTGGHSWPGGKGRRGKNPSPAIIADDVIWDFFSTQVR
jgi:polyhydroxybutyrate depolymerase